MKGCLGYLSPSVSLDELFKVERNGGGPHFLLFGWFRYSIPFLY